MHIFGLFLSLNNYDSTIMMKSFPLILAIVLIAPSKAYCQIKGQQKNGPTSNTAVKISDESWDKMVDRVFELVDHDNQKALDLLVQKAQVLYRLGRTKEAILVFQEFTNHRTRLQIVGTVNMISKETKD